MEKEIKRGLPFGRQQQVGNYLVLKYNKTLSGKAIKELRTSSEAAAYMKQRGIHLNRGGVPFIKVSTVGGDWEIHFGCTSTMFHYIDSRFTWKGDECGLDNDSYKALYSLFLLFYGDTTIMGDAEYIENKGLCLKDFLERQKAVGKTAPDGAGTVAESAEEKAADDAVVEDMKKMEEAKANIVDMGAAAMTSRPTEEENEKGGSNEG